MNELATGEVNEVAARQVSFGACFGIGHELESLGGVLTDGEHPLVVATGFVDGAFGVIAMTTSRVLWAPSGEDEIAVRSIRLADIVGITPLEPQRYGARLVTRDRAESLEVEQVIPADAVDEIERRLHDPPHKVSGYDLQPA